MRLYSTQVRFLGGRVSHPLYPNVSYAKLHVTDYIARVSIFSYYIGPFGIYTCVIFIFNSQYIAASPLLFAF